MPTPTAPFGRLCSTVDDVAIATDLITDPDLGLVISFDLQGTVGSVWPDGGTIHGAGLFSPDEAELHARRVLAQVALTRTMGEGGRWR